jgi:hypothetical protein
MIEPKPIQSHSRTGAYLDRIVRGVRRNRLNSSSTVLVHESGKNATLHVRLPPGGGRGFRGEWTPRAFKAGDSVKISNGLEAGFYIATKNVPAAPSVIPADWEHYPWLGQSWSLCGRVNDQSSWL